MKKKFFWLVLSLMTLFLVACGGGEKKEETTDSANANTEISGKIVIYTSMYEDIIDNVSEKLKKEFPNLEVEFFQGGTGTLQSKIIAELQANKLGCDMLMVAEPSYSLELKEKGIDSPKKLEGKKYATWEDNIEQAILKKLVTDDKGDFSKVKLIPYTITDVVTGLKTDVDAVWVYYAWDGIATERAGLQTNFLKIRDYGEELDYYSPVIIANNDFLKKNPEIAKKVLKAIKKGYEYAIKNPEESAKILVKNSPELDINLVTASQKWISKEYQSDAKEWGIIDENRWNRFYEWLYKNKAVEREIPKNFGYSNEYLK